MDWCPVNRLLIYLSVYSSTVDEKGTALWVCGSLFVFKNKIFCANLI